VLRKLVIVFHKCEQKSKINLIIYFGKKNVIPDMAEQMRLMFFLEIGREERDKRNKGFA